MPLVYAPENATFEAPQAAATPVSGKIKLRCPKDDAYAGVEVDLDSLRDTLQSAEGRPSNPAVATDVREELKRLGFPV